MVRQHSPPQPRPVLGRRLLTGSMARWTYLVALFRATRRRCSPCFNSRQCHSAPSCVPTLIGR